ncbi:MAG: tetratricopeptide repeat protein [Deltaproteobacteria bacterium]|nr:tetratricopeptide repeat protein [Deltaproteobacteria bacterium]MBW2138626.1 tetratricopeptide repeat protein [Deltaproteobacteria bacterium]
MDRVFNSISPRNLILYLLLAVLVALPYWRLGGHDFVNLDDNHYITENPAVREGITLRGISWAFSFNDTDYWHPLTWLSHMFDMELFGLEPGGHHLHNLILHIINSLLLFAILKRMTGAPWRSAAVALLFGLHPLNVESVAWVAERKNLLSALFWMITILSYIRYAERPLVSRYVLTLLFFALGLMAKPTAATLPMVLLLLDYWPLGTLLVGRGETAMPQAAPAISESKSPSLLVLLKEKVPFLALSGIAISLSSFSAARRSLMVTVETAPWLLRVENALVSYVMYIKKMFWPVDLAVFYPYEQVIPLWKAATACALLAAITTVALAKARRHPYFTLGWFWYIVTLLPAIGLVQVGLWPEMADRFVYIPIIGLLIILVWGFHSLLGRLPLFNVLGPAALACVSFALMLTTASQTSYWQNSENLFLHALRVTRGNHLAYNNLGSFYASQGDLEKASLNLEKAVRIMPDNPLFLNNLGTVLARRGDYTRAAKILGKALNIAPNYAEAYTNMGYVLSRRGKAKEAISLFRRALEIKPLPEAHHNLGLIFAGQKDFEQAFFHYQEALLLRPGDAKVHNDLGVALAQQGKIREAISHLREALRLQPNYPQARHNLNVLLERIRTPGKTINK